MSAKLTRWELEALESWIGLVPPGDEKVCTDIYRLIAHVRAQEEALREIIGMDHQVGCPVSRAELDCDEANEICPRPDGMHEDAGCECPVGIARAARMEE